LSLSCWVSFISSSSSSGIGSSFYSSGFSSIFDSSVGYEIDN
jgi:hypothetical protein